MAKGRKRKCAVAGCGVIRFETDTDITFHRFPGTKDEESKLLRREWIKRCCREESFSVDNSRICSLHFKDDDFIEQNNQEISGFPFKRTLKNHVIPTMNLPYYNTKKIPNFRSSSSTRVKIKHGEFMKGSSKGFVGKQKEKIGLKGQKNGKEALGEEILRVCRTCLKVIKMEESTPLMVGGFKTDLFMKLESILQMDLFPVKNSCLCKNCENFIIATQNFRESCAVNEEVIKSFDWENKSRNLLHLIDENTLRNKLTNNLSSNQDESIEKEEDMMVDESLDPIGLGEEENHSNNIKFKTELQHSEEELEDSENDDIFLSENILSSEFLKAETSYNDTDRCFISKEMNYSKNFDENNQKRPCDTVCKFCGEIYHKNSISKHIELKHENDNSKVSFLSMVGCDICGKKYFREEDLQFHKRNSHRKSKNVAIKGNKKKIKEEDDEYLFVEELTDDT